MPVPSSQLRIGCIGAGRRMQTMYLPILRRLAEQFALVGFTQRRRAIGRENAARLDMPYYPTLAKLVTETRPEVLLISVPPKANAEVTQAALRFGIPLLIETPIATTVSDARTLVRRVKEQGTLVGVLEQKPFLPLEQWKYLCVHSGVLGEIVVVQNDFRSYEYHAIAQLRRYLPPETKPKRVSAVAEVIALPAFETRERTPGPATDVWRLAYIQCTGRELLIHHMSSAYKIAPFRTEQSLRIYGTKGTLSNSHVAFVDPVSRQTIETTVEVRKNAAGGIERVRAIFSHDQEIVWTSQFSSQTFTDDETAIATHLVGMHACVLGNGQPVYSMEEALCDLEVVSAARWSADMNGRVIHFPLRRMDEWPRYVSPTYWKQMGKKWFLAKKSRI